MNQAPFSEAAESRTPGEVAGLVGDEADGAALDPGQGDEQVRRPIRAELEQRALVGERLGDGADVVDLAWRGGDERAGVGARRRRRGDGGRALVAVRRQVAEQRADERRGVSFALGLQRRDAVGGVHGRAAELRHADLLGEHLGDDPGAGQEHARLPAHDDEVGERRRVAAAARRRPVDDGDLRDPAGAADVLGEDPAVAVERRGALVHTSAAGVDQADHGYAGLARRLLDADDRPRVLGAERAAEERRVLAVHEDGPAGDLGAAGEQAVAGRRPARATGADARADRSEAAAVAERLDPPQRQLAGGRRVVSLCEGAAAHAPPVPSSATTALWPPNPNEFEIARGAPLAVCSGRGPSAT